MYSRQHLNEFGLNNHITGMAISINIASIMKEAPASNLFKNTLFILPKIFQHMLPFFHCQKRKLLFVFQEAFGLIYPVLKSFSTRYKSTENGKV